MAIVIGSTSAGVLGTLTLGELKTMIQARGYATDTSAQQTTMIRETLRELYGERRWKFLAGTSTAFTLALGTPTITLGSLGRGIMLDSVRLARSTTVDGGSLKYLDPVALARKLNEDWETGRPQYWSRRGDTLTVYPRPDAAYALALDYQALTTLPSSDGDSIIWPETHAQVIVWAVVQQLAYRQRDWNGHDRAKVSYAEALQRMFRDEEDTDRETGLEVQPGGSLSWQDVV